MKAAVAVPPVRDFYLTRKRFSALGAQLVTRLLSDLGVPSELFIFPLLKEKGTRIPLPHPLSYLQEFVLEEEKGQTSFFRHYHYFGPSFSDCARMIHESGADILFLSCFAFCYASETLSLSAEVKRRIPELPVVVGGAGVSVYPEYFLREDSIDFALTGEAEVCLEEFLRALTKHRSWQSVPNLYWKDGARIRAPRITRQTDSDTIRIPWRLMHNGENSLLFSTVLSRGCDRTCRYCSISLSHGEGFRMPSPATISRTFDEMAQAAAGGNAGRNVEVKINFEDDNLLFAAESVEGHLLTLSSRFDKVSFYGENGFDLSLLSPARVRKLIGLGMRQFNLSIASTNRSSLDRESRNFQPRLYETIMAELRSRNIPSVTYFICGLKGDTTETVSDNLVFLARHPTLIGISSFYTVPGMPDFAKRSSFDVVPPILCAGSSFHPWNGSLSTRQLVTAFRLSRFINFIKSGPRSGLDRELVYRSLKYQRLYTRIRNEKLIPVPAMDEALVRLTLGRLRTSPILSNPHDKIDSRSLDIDWVNT